MNQPFAPRSEKDYSAISARIQYKLKNLQLLAQTHTDYNANSDTLSSYSSHSRTYSGSVSWTPKSWFTLDGTYTKLHLDTLGGIQFFVNSQLLTGQTSYYISNLHTGTLGMHFTPLSRLDVYLAYSHVQDTGDGRTASNATAIGPNLPAFQMAQTFPLRFETPIARLSIRISEKIRWNVGYQYFGYHSDFSPAEDYLAHTGYTSVLWSF